MKFIDRFATLVRADAHGVLEQLEERTLLAQAAPARRRARAGAQARAHRRARRRGAPRRGGAAPARGGDGVARRRRRARARRRQGGAGALRRAAPAAEAPRRRVAAPAPRRDRRRAGAPRREARGAGGGARGAAPARARAHRRSAGRGRARARWCVELPAADEEVELELLRAPRRRASARRERAAPFVRSLVFALAGRGSAARRARRCSRRSAASARALRALLLAGVAAHVAWSPRRRAARGRPRGRARGRARARCCWRCRLGVGATALAGAALLGVCRSGRPVPVAPGARRCCSRPPLHGLRPRAGARSSPAAWRSPGPRRLGLLAGARARFFRSAASRPDPTIPRRRPLRARPRSHPGPARLRALARPSVRRSNREIPLRGLAERRVSCSLPARRRFRRTRGSCTRPAPRTGHVPLIVAEPGKVPGAAAASRSRSSAWQPGRRQNCD